MRPSAGPLDAQPILTGVGHGAVILLTAALTMAAPGCGAPASNTGAATNPQARTVRAEIPRPRPSPPRLVGPQMLPWPELEVPLPGAGLGQADRAVIVGLETYAAVAPIPGARKNAEAWFDYFVASRGLPPDGVRLLLDQNATREAIKGAITASAREVGASGTLWFVFIGHGAPSKEGRDGLLVGWDAQQKARSVQVRSLRRSELLTALEASPAAAIRVVLDACFSGRVDARRFLVPGDQNMVISRFSSEVDRRTVLLTAARGDQFAGPLPGAARPAFSYLVLGGLRGWADANRDRTVTAREILRYATRALRSTARDRLQEPTLLGEGRAALSVGVEEAGPNLAALAKVAAQPSSRRFALNLGPAETVPRIGDFQAERPVMNLPEVDLELLKRLQRAKRAEAAGKPYLELAALWRAVAAQAPDAEYQQDLDGRANDWADLNAAHCRRRAQAAVVRRQKEQDQLKLERLLAFDDNVVSSHDKRAFKAEFEAAYAPWEGLLKATDKRSVCVPDGMVKVPGGPFLIGCNESVDVDCFPNEASGKMTHLDTFLIDWTEVTVDAYGECVRAGRCSPPDDKSVSSYCNWGHRDRGHHPVNCVDWRQARTYCKFRGKRLPTEAEWEKAARGIEGGKYPWRFFRQVTCEDAIWADGRKADGCGRGSTWPVGSKPSGRSPYGAVDMAGNVWEWTGSKYEDTDQRVFRGGGWLDSNPAFLRTSTRFRGPPSTRRYSLGFRCARSED